MGPQPMVAHFQVSGERVTGRLEADQGSQAFSGTLSGDQVSWEMKVTRPMSIVSGQNPPHSHDFAIW
jgi:carbon-monoxide dehydrogenase large subunit